MDSFMQRSYSTETASCIQSCVVNVLNFFFHFSSKPLTPSSVIWLPFCYLTPWGQYLYIPNIRESTCYLSPLCYIYLCFIYFLFEISSHYLARADLKLSVYLPQPREGWDFKHLLPAQLSSCVLKLKIILFSECFETTSSYRCFFWNTKIPPYMAIKSCL